MVRFANFKRALCRACRTEVLEPRELCWECLLSRNSYLNQLPERDRGPGFYEWMEHHRPVELATIWGRHPW